MRVTLRGFHLSMVVLWLGLTVPGVIVWRDSILFVIVCSLYANVEASFAAYMSARAEDSNSTQAPP